MKQPINYTVGEWATTMYWVHEKKKIVICHN
jgi:hypothetical protein